MARIHELIKQLRASHPELGAEIAREVEVLSQRRAFGLNFERHTPEAVELPGRRVRVGDTVRVLPPRGRMPSSADQRLWKVRSIEGAGENRVAHLETQSATGDSESTVNAVADLVVITEFRQPIYPGLESTGKVERGGDKPYHAVINAENYHALQALLFTHRGAVDAIYIDPPYNTGARDWKYNNDYVEGDDMYRHSKWLAFMERRLLLAKELLNPEDSVLIVTIDEKEYLRLGLLLERTFPAFKIQMVSSVINPRGVVRANEFSRSNEFIFFVWAPGSVLQAPGRSESRGEPVAWETMRRRSLAGRRGNRGPGACGPNQFFPIHVNPTTGHIVGRGDPLPVDFPVDSYVPPSGTVAVFPARDDGTEMNWSLTDVAFDLRWREGFVRAGKATPEKPQKYLIQYVLGGVIEDIREGRARVIGRRADGSVIAEYVEEKTLMPHTQWDVPSHNAQENGTGLLRRVLPDRRFPYAKSLYAVEDALRLFIAHKPNATVVDFFAGSGTTAHAVMRLNRRDGGSRTSISITNNEVGASEQQTFRAEGLRPGDPDWEKWGICDYVTKPRVKAAITGKTPDGEPIKGDYKFNDEFPMADGLEENVEFFTLTYETPMRVQSHREFARIAPLLWLRAGSRGRRIENLSEGWDVAEAYGVLADIDKSDAFVQAMAANPGARLAFIVTDEDRFFEAIAHALPEGVETVRLYDSYLRNFEIDAMRGVR
ncbi:site-specific DNA-methyltransferase [Microbacterium sp. KNMS]